MPSGHALRAGQWNGTASRQWLRPPKGAGSERSPRETRIPTRQYRQLCAEFGRASLARVPCPAALWQLRDSRVPRAVLLLSLRPGHSKGHNRRARAETLGPSSPSQAGHGIRCPGRVLDWGLKRKAWHGIRADAVPCRARHPQPQAGDPQNQLGSRACSERFAARAGAVPMLRVVDGTNRSPRPSQRSRCSCRDNRPSAAVYYCRLYAPSLKGACVRVGHGEPLRAGPQARPGVGVRRRV